MINSESTMNNTAVDQPSQATELQERIDTKNLLDNIDDDVKAKILAQVHEGFEYDLTSRAEWEQNLNEWTNLALQVREEKSYPWPKSSNVKYPLLSIAALQFNARAYPSLVPTSGDVVKCKVLGKDQTGQKLEQANRVSKFMSYQLMHEMSGWEEDMDKLLVMLPVVGTMFKKTYHDAAKNHNVSELILPKNIVVNYWAKSLDDAERISEVIYLNKRQVKERQMEGTYLDVVLPDPVGDTDKNTKVPLVQDATLPYYIVEQHTFFDLDDDGYAEPYIVTFERHSKTLLRMVARFDVSGVKLNDKNKLVRIEPTQYYTKFGFIPNPDGGFYDIGFGVLLGPINESVNTLINQLVDAGTLNNLQGGILGKGLKLKMGDSQWQPGEWKTAQTASDDIRKQIVPLPTKEPSKVLFELMGTLITSGKELASVAEIFVGKMPGQNTPATTTMATIEQGMKVFTAVYKRIYRSLTEEYKKLYRLNRDYLDLEQYQNVMDIQVTIDDFDEKSYNVCPNADPSTPTQTEKLMKAQGLVELLPLGTLDPLAVTMRVLEAQEQPSIEQLFTQQIQQTGAFEPPPDPKMMEMQMKGQIEQQKAELKKGEVQHKMAMEQRSKEFELAMKAQEHHQKMQGMAQEAQLQGALELHKQRIFNAAEMSKTQQSLVQNDAKHQQTMRQTEEKQKLAQKQQTKTSSTTGKNTR